MTRTYSRLFFALACTFALASCAGPPVATTFTDDPVCPDFTLGASTNKMRGGLRNPIHVTVKDGKNAIGRALFVGKRVASDPSPPLMIPDANGSFTVEWAQCPNERASVPIGGKANRRDGSTGYECGDAAVFKTETLTTKKGDLSTHTLAVPAPPIAECWKDTGMAEAPVVELPDAGAPDATTQDAGADDAGLLDASAPETQAPVDAGSLDAGHVHDAGH